MKTDIRFRKYEFLNEQEATEKIVLLLGDEIVDNVIPKVCSHYLGLRHLGFIMTKAGEYDEQENEIKPPTFSNKYSIDVFWRDLEPDDWKGKKIKLGLNKNSHTFQDFDYEDD